ncbi:hypothetical protein BSL78_10745 [Apostichopus japonicus]|uniref:Uncharacterized protein n=1 Tax=Stichopus japonicus TaxID=307972 RepID=A0A2G8KWJ3_STIJA|nr:hypothetical protein BSL78_10745 [Apostichopus japonicus]
MLPKLERPNMLTEIKAVNNTSRTVNKISYENGCTTVQESFVFVKHCIQRYLSTSALGQPSCLSKDWLGPSSESYVCVSYRLSAQLGLGTPTARRLQDNAVPSLFGESIFKSREDIETSRPVVEKLDRKRINLEAVPQPTAVKIQKQDSAECTSPSKVNVTHVEVQCSLVPLPPLKLLTEPTETRTPSKQPGPSHSGDDGLSAAVASSSGYTEKPPGSPDYTPSVHSSDESEHDKDDASR